MRAQLTLVLLFASSVVAGAQPSASVAGTVPELPPIGLPLPTIGLPFPSMGLPPPAPRPPDAAALDRRPQRSPDRARRGARPVPPAIYFIPTFVAASAPEAPPPDAAPTAGRLRVDVDPHVAGQVYLDGYYIGSTGDLDRAMDVASGRHTIEIRADGYQTLQDELAIAAGRSVTYRGALTLANARLVPAEAGPAEPAVVTPRPTVFYVIPGCYIGNVPPEDAGLPATCDLSRAITITR